MKKYILRGGSWYGLPVAQRVSRRHFGNPTCKGKDVGFRIIKIKEV